MAGRADRKRNREKQIGWQRRLMLVLISFFLTFCILQTLLMVMRCAPYGNRTLATGDARIQYLDFFSYLKDVLAGKNSIGYTFTTTLGMNAIGLFSYYLSSPFNLFVLFFEKSQMNSFLNFIVTLKLATAAGTFSWFLQRRFEDHIPEWIMILLSAGYSLMQYNLTQCSNVMWLDGVYMLPLILLGVCRCVRSGRILGLSVSVGLAILFNWYSAGMDCLYAIVWFVFEYMLWRLDRREAAARIQKRRAARAAAAAGGDAGAEASAAAAAGREERKGIREKIADLAFFRYVRQVRGLWSEDRRAALGTALRPAVRLLTATVRFGFAMGVGVMISAALFLPTIAILRRGKGGAFYPEEYMVNRMRGNLLWFIRDYRIGEVSTVSTLALFCGSLALMGCLAFFTCRKYSAAKRVLGGLLLLFTLLTFYWQPLFYVFSLLKDVNSYWYRHGYIGSFAILFLAAAYFRARPRMEPSPAVASSFAPVIVTAAAAVLMVAQWALAPSGSSWMLVASVLCLLAVSVLWILPAVVTPARRRNMRRISTVALIAVSLLELTVNARVLLRRYSSESVEEYRTYSVGQQAQIAEIRARDTGFYRISQTSARYYDGNGMTACFNDSLAYNYPSVAYYTSTPEYDQMWFLDRMGYQEEGTCMNIVDTSIVSADAYLGVKYVLSEYPIKGLTRVPGLGVYNGKTVYENPFVLPLAFVYSGAEMPKHSYNDPFTYQNELFSVLADRYVTLYKPAEVARQQVSSTEAVWKLKAPAGNQSLYGNLKWKKFLNGTLTVDGTIRKGYARWLSPTVFYIPSKEGNSSFVTLETQETLDLDSEEFFTLDLDELAVVTRQIRDRKPSELTVENGHITCTAEAQEGERLMLTIPQSEGWTVRVNGRRVATGKFAYCMMTVPLDAGTNEVELTFGIPYLEKGLLASAAGILLLAAYELLRMWIERESARRRALAKRSDRKSSK